MAPILPSHMLTSRAESDAEVSLKPAAFNGQRRAEMAEPLLPWADERIEDLREQNRKGDIILDVPSAHL